MKRFTFIDKLANEKWNVEITIIVQSQKFKGIYKSGAEQIINLLKNRMDVYHVKFHGEVIILC